jgi:hypothetical protein
MLRKAVTGLLLGSMILAILAMLAGCADPTPPSGGSRQPGVPGLGRLWLLTGIAHAGTDVVVPAALRATLQLSADGQFVASDTVNTMSGKFTRTVRGFEVPAAVTTAVGYAGRDPARLAVISAMSAVADGTDVGAAASRTALTLSVKAYVLTFRDVGAAVVYPSAPPTGTGTAASH